MGLGLFLFREGGIPEVRTGLLMDTGVGTNSLVPGTKAGIFGKKRGSTTGWMRSFALLFVFSIPKNNPCMSWNLRKRTLVAGLLAAFTMMALLSGLQPYLTSESSATWWAYLTGHLTHWYLWALLTPLIYQGVIWLLDRTLHWSLLVLILVLLSAPFSVIHSSMEFGIFEAFPTIRGAYPRVSPLRFISGHIPTGTLTFGLLAGLMIAVQYVWRYNDQTEQARQLALSTATLKAQLAQAQLQALRMQLHPHFLYNTLQSISTLMYRDVAQADRVLLDLSSLLRLTFEQALVPKWSLQDEIQWLKHYLDIESVRFQDRLSVVYDLDDTSLNAEVPTLILQPLVENALRHGLGPQNKPGQLNIKASIFSNQLHLSVEDNGTGYTPSVLRSGVGLTNTRARLSQHYGDTGELTLSPLSPTGCRATLYFPLKPHVPDATD